MWEKFCECATYFFVLIDFAYRQTIFPLILISLRRGQTSFIRKAPVKQTLLLVADLSHIISLFILSLYGSEELC